MRTLSLIPKGDIEHRRYIIAASEHEFWTGTDWTSDEQKAMLFSNPKEIDLKSIVDPTGTPRKFVAPIELEMFGDEQIDMFELQIWLMNAARLYVDYTKGKTKNFMILGIDWTELKEVA